MVKTTKQSVPKAYDFKETYPDHISIVAMGRTAEVFLRAMQTSTYFHSFPQEVWGINQTYNWAKLDRLFVMDTEAEYKINVEDAELLQGLLSWRRSLLKATIPIYTTINDSKWPTGIEFPLQEVVTEINIPIADTYFMNTVPYALAYAIAIGVKRIDLFGMDFEYMDPKTGIVHTLEQYRACVEFWAGIALGRGISVRTPNESGLFYMNHRGYYGYGEDQPDIVMNSW